MSTLTCHLVTRDPDAAAAWYGSVLGAVETSRITLPGGQVMTIELRFGDSTLAIADEFPDMGVVSPRTLAAYASPGGRVTILEAGRATLELADPPHAAYIDDVEVGQRVAGHIRVAFEVSDTAAATSRLAAAGATVIAEPAPTPWQSLNARLEGPAGLQLTLFSDLADPGAET